MRTTLLAAIVLSLTSPALAQVTTGLPDFSQEDDLDPRIEVLYKNEASGIQQYERGEHDKAFELLSETAVQGLKDSQYVMAFMFLKGEHVGSFALWKLHSVDFEVVDAGRPDQRQNPFAELLIPWLFQAREIRKHPPGRERDRAESVTVVA